MLEFNGTAIVIAISFIVFVIIENLIFYRPMKKVLSERENYIAKNEQEAGKNLSDAKLLVDEKDKKISKAKENSAEILNKASLKVQQEYNDEVTNAKLNSNKKLEELRNTLDEEKMAAQNSLRDEIGSHATMIISKILKKDVSVVNLNDELIDKALRGEL